MVDYRAALAVVLGVGLGLFLLVAPETVVRVQTAGRLPSDRRGQYGEEADVPERWRRLVQVLGVACVGVGLYVAWTAFLA